MKRAARVKTFWIATMDTRHFRFVATGATKDKAIAAMRKRWDEHITAIPKHRRGNALTWAQFVKEEGQTPMVWFDSTTKKVVLGKGYRDGESEEDS